MYCRFCLIKWISLYVFYVCNLYFLLAIIGPPIIFLSGCGHCLNISISLPSESMKVDQLHRFYNSVSFNISWKKAGQNEVSIPVKIVFFMCSNRIRCVIADFANSTVFFPSKTHHENSPLV